MAARRMWWGLGLGLLGVLAGCGGDDAPEPFLVVSGPRAVARIELRDADRAVVWSLVAEPAAPLAELVYGTVPDGFTQQLPAAGSPPRPLVAGEPLTLEWTTPLRVIVHRGYADSGNRFVIGDWETGLRADGAGGSPAPGGALGDPDARP